MNSSHKGKPERDTAAFSSPGSPGNLRIDYVLVSQGLGTGDAAVFWPEKGEPAADLVTAASFEDVRPADPSLNGILPLLNEARGLPAGYEASMDSPSLGMRWGLYQGERLGEHGTIPAYDRILERAFLPRIMIRMEQELSSAMTSSSTAFACGRLRLRIAFFTRVRLLAFIDNTS